ncbi:MAG: hypothetical protein BWX69_00578 [Planctomycetes bacterium ADurb.Bin069]|nr:MAG: hypothetical protein BWX69_00578 [Planctomycetes bacterium ADurb.Bin069]
MSDDGGFELVLELRVRRAIFAASAAIFATMAVRSAVRFASVSLRSAFSRFSC